MLKLRSFLLKCIIFSISVNVCFQYSKPSQSCYTCKHWHKQNLFNSHQTEVILDLSSTNRKLISRQISHAERYLHIPKKPFYGFFSLWGSDKRCLHLNVIPIVSLASYLLQHLRWKCIVCVCLFLCLHAHACVKCILVSCRLAGSSQRRFYYLSVAFICLSSEKSSYLRWVGHSATCIHDTHWAEECETGIFSKLVCCWIDIFLSRLQVSILALLIKLPMFCCVFLILFTDASSHSQNQWMISVEMYELHLD